MDARDLSPLMLAEVELAREELKLRSSEDEDSGPTLDPVGPYWPLVETLAHLPAGEIPFLNPRRMSVRISGRRAEVVAPNGALYVLDQNLGDGVVRRVSAPSGGTTFVRYVDRVPVEEFTLLDEKESGPGEDRSLPESTGDQGDPDERRPGDG